MNNVRFFAYSTGASPRIWATGDVQGTNNGDPSGLTVNLTGSSGTAEINTDFTVNSWGGEGGKWNASVANGSGFVSGHSIEMKGGAAGSVDSATTFSGTASGVAKPQATD